MKHGIPTTTEPNRPECLYMRNMFHEFFWGPFETEDELEAAVAKLDVADPYWDYEAFCIIHGANPLPKDFVFGFLPARHAFVSRVHGRPRAPLSSSTTVVP
jgi:hypothetical protein